jgi:capsular exopolysaccharide synthesis family protein
MTTLPQTTPIRLPRPGGSTPLAINAPSAGVGTSASQMSAGDVWRVIRANLWLIFLFIVMSAVGGFYLNQYLERHFSVYTATGLVQILPLQPVDPLHITASPGVDLQSLPIEEKTQSQILKSEGLINKVLGDASSPIRSTSWWLNTCKSDPQIAHRLLGDKFSASPIPESKLILVAMTASEPKDTVTILSAMVNEAIQQQKESIREKNQSERLRLVAQKDIYTAKLRAASDEVANLSSQLETQGMATIVGGTGAKSLEMAEKIRVQLEIQGNYEQVKTTYDTFMAQLAKGEEPTEVSSAVEADNEVANARAQVEAYDTQIGLQADSLGTNNPAVVSMQKRREYLENKLEDLKALKAANYTELWKTKLQTACDNLNKQKDAAEKSVEKLQADMSDLSNKLSTLMIRRTEEAQDREYVNQYQKILDDMDQMVRAADFSALDWQQRPVEPDHPSFPNLTATMGASIALGLALSLGIAFLREATDTTVRSPRDILRVGNMNLLGMVPHEADDPQASGARLPLVIFEAPHSMMAEQFRQVRTRLQHAASLDTTRSILVTSPSPGDGKSTVACNLAAGLALNGRRILLVDANFRRPELHRIFGIGNEVGFSDVLNDVTTFPTAVQTTTIPNLSVMASGVKPSNPTELLESQLLLDFIERALEEYDHVIFDSGPMLFVSESVALAPRVDGVVTVLRARTSTRGVLQRMRDGLRAVKAEHLGVVLNGVRSQAGGYYGRSIKTYYEYQNG